MRGFRPETLSHLAALVCTTALGAVLWLNIRNVHPEVSKTAEPLQVVLLEPTPQPPAPDPVQPPQPVPEPPRPVPHLPHRDHHEVVPQPLMAAVPSAEPVDAPAPEAVPADAPSPPAHADGKVEDQYAATLRTNIDARTRPPDSAEYRLLKPHGEVQIGFTLDRGGSLIAAQLAHSSGSKILDRHALDIVQTGRYPPFPETAFPGELRHSFVVTLEFHT